MKKNYFMPLVVFIILWGSCKEKNVEVAEKLVFTEVDFKNCECVDKIAVCYFDTVKTFLLVLNNVTGTFLQEYGDSTKVRGILLDNPYSYIKGSIEYGEEFYFWWIISGYLMPCNLPDVIINKKYKNRKIRFSCNVHILPPPPKGLSYPQIAGFPISLTKLEIIDN